MSGKDLAKPPGEAAKQPGERRSKPRRKAGDVGRALRTVYDDTLREEIPADFLDLLGKLD